ncbi:hypothetical protein PCE1_001440 [Barthelona sp. PCE]
MGTEARSLQDYEEIENVGSGTYGVVVKALDKRNDDIVALKSMKLGVSGEGIPSTAIREISLLKVLNHDNIVNLHHVIHDNDNLTLVFEFCETDLKKYIKKHGSIPYPQIQTWMRHLCEAVAYCHDESVLHRDIKPQNLLIDDNMVLKLADFGLARSIGIPHHHFAAAVVTLWYRPPDVLLGWKHYEYDIDIWSLGCVIAECFIGKSLFSGDNATGLLSDIFTLLGAPILELPFSVTSAPNYWPDFDKYNKDDCDMSVRENAKLLPVLLREKNVPEIAIDLITTILVLDPKQRPTIHEVLEHDFFRTEWF